MSHTTDHSGEPASAAHGHHFSSGLAARHKGVDIGLTTEVDAEHLLCAGMTLARTRSRPGASICPWSAAASSALVRRGQVLSSAHFATVDHKEAGEDDSRSRAAEAGEPVDTPPPRNWRSNETGFLLRSTTSTTADAPASGSV